MSRLDPLFLTIPIAHRGLHDEPNGVIENSRSAFAAAIEHGFAIECDLQCTLEGKAVVFHDEALERLTGEVGMVCDRSLAEITSITLKNSTDKIQSLHELLEQVTGQVPLLIEIKDQSLELGPFLGAFMDDIIAQLRRYKGPLAIMSFNPHIIAHMRVNLLDACLGLTTDDFTSQEWPNVPIERAKSLNNFSEVSGLEIDFISHHWRDLERVAHMDIPKFAWTIKNAVDEAQARKIADNITFECYKPAQK